MSYILDALKKAEHQREIGHVPGIGSTHETTAATARWTRVLLVVLLLNAVLLAFALWPESSLKSRVAPAPGDSPVRTPLSLPTPSEPAPEREQVRKSLQPQPPLESRQMPETLRPPAVQTVLRPLPPLPEPRQADVVGDTALNAIVSQPGRVAPMGAPPVASANTGNDNLPAWPQVSDQLFREINSDLHLDVHVYSDQPHERFVLVNMRKYHEGERLQEGPVVDAITPGEVILSFRGQRFRMQSQ